MTVIKDGTGAGFLVRVTEEHRLATVSVSVPQIANESIEDGLAFQIEGETTIVAGVEKTVLIIINNSDDLISIERIFTSVQNETGIIITARIYLGQSTITAGGTAKTPINLNTASLNTIDVTALENNPTLGGTDTKIQEHYFRLTDTECTEYFGAINLAKNKSIRVTCEGSAGATGTFTCDASILFFITSEIVVE